MKILKNAGNQKSLKIDHQFFKIVHIVLPGYSFINRKSNKVFVSRSKEKVKISSS